MAADAALLDGAVQSPGPPVVRIYGWSEPTISMGYLQKIPRRHLTAPLADCPRVRRLTGGGAILHDREITYSCVVPRDHPAADRPLGLYSLIHTAIRNCLRTCGVPAGYRVDLPQGEPAEQHFLCFLRSDPRDLAVQPVGSALRPKITGSAQRRRKGTILQHGSILLRASPLLPSIPGVCDLFPGFDEEQLQAILPESLAGVLGRTLERTEYSDSEIKFAFDYVRCLRQNRGQDFLSP